MVTSQLPTVEDEFLVSFPAMRGVQAGREYYVIMCPLRYMPRLFLFDEDDLPPELRAQRALNRGRIPALTRYVIENRDNYVFSALTASVDGLMDFRPSSGDKTTERLGLLKIAMNSRFLINDGQHRRAAIEEALKEDPSLAEETIPIVIFADEGLRRSQQMFADLNRHAVRPHKSIGVLYDHRDDDSGVARLMVLKSPFFKPLVEMERSALSARSRKLFTLSSLYGGTQALLAGMQFANLESAAEVARNYWEAVAVHIPEWGAVKTGQMTAGEVRAEFIHSHGIGIGALGRVGNALLRATPNSDVWPKRLALIETIDWSRANSTLWEGRALIGGRVSKTSNNVTLVSNVLKAALSLAMTAEEERIEHLYERGAK